jgi:hypothetical protein
MKHKQSRIYNKLISWDTEEQAMNSEVVYKCPECRKLTTYLPIKNGVGKLVEIDELNLNRSQSKKLTEMSESYYAPIRNVQIFCPNNHNYNILIIFGETQPARYVLVV